MKHFRNIAFAALAGCIGFALLPSLHADEWNKKTVLTITEPLEVPSCCTPDHTVILQPGEYVMVLVDSLSDRHIVRIFDKDQKHVMTTILAIPNYRLTPTGKTVFGFWEVPAGQPAALRAWFYPGDNFGQEFAYPKQKAAEIAAFVKVPVPAIVAETAAEEDLRTTPLVVVQETGATQPVAQVAVAEVAPTPAPVAVAEEPAPVAAEPAPMLPKTASNMPLVGLAGLVSLAMFAVLGLKSRRLASKA
jgi:LPXTG-motif cell wall-anchored protein